MRSTPSAPSSTLRHSHSGKVDPDLEIHKRYFQVGLFTSFVVSLVTAVCLMVFGMPVLSLIAWGFLAVEAVLFWLFLTKPDLFPILLHTNVLLCFILPFVLQVLLGGFVTSGGIGVWAIVVPMSAIILRMPLSWLWFVSLVVMESLAMALEIHLRGQTPHLPMSIARWLLVFNLLGAALYIFLRVKHVLQVQADLRAEIQKTHNRLLKESWKTERLLMNIFPLSIANRLKEKPGPLSESYSDISVLFADISGFTRLASELKPQQVVELLNDIFRVFDILTEEYSLEKIKTIGDAYMVVGNLPQPSSGHLESIADMALVMMKVFPEKMRKYPDLGLRVGIHCGPVVAGVIGRKKLSYDLWGDTVNIANRMESHGTPGKIQVSEVVYQRLKDHYAFESRGQTTIRGKGNMHTYWLKEKLNGDPRIPDLDKPQSEFEFFF